VGWCLLMCGAGFASGAAVAVAGCCRFYLHMYDNIAWHQAKVQCSAKMQYKTKVQNIERTDAARDGAI
jgi:hypothetical protein